MIKRIAYSVWRMAGKIQSRIESTRATPSILNTPYSIRSGFTLVETLVAISLLSIAIVAPMSLTTQSLVGAYYARDQVTAFFLAQEAIEAVRSARDANVLATALGTPTDLMTGIPSSGAAFTVDAHTVPVTMSLCSGTCAPLQTDGEFYGYQSGWSDTNFTRYVTATYVPGTSNNEIEISATVVWQTAAYEPRTFTLKANLYRWVFDSSAVTVEEGSTPPPAVTNLTVSCPSPGTSAAINWAASPGATSYGVNVNNDTNPWAPVRCDGTINDGNTNDLCWAEVASPAYTFPFGIAGTGYWVTVYAENSNGISPVSQVVNFTCAS